MNFYSIFETSMKLSLFGKEKDQFDSLDISEFIDSEKCSYSSPKNQLFQNTLEQWTCSRVPNTAQISMAALLS